MIFKTDAYVNDACRKNAIVIVSKADAELAVENAIVATIEACAYQVECGFLKKGERLTRKAAARLVREVYRP